jgi:hypothetical protein
MPSSSAPAAAAPASAPALTPSSSGDSLADLEKLIGGQPAADPADIPDDAAEDTDPADDDTDPAPEAADDEAAADDNDEAAPEEPAADDAEPAPEAGDDEDAALRAKFTPQQQKVLDKIIGKKAAKLQELRAQLEPLTQRAAALEQENASLKQGLPPPAATAESPLADVASESELAAREQNAIKLKRWLTSHRDGGEMPDGKGGTVEISAERRDELLGEVDELLTYQAPARRQFLAARRQFDGQLRQIYPPLADPKHPASIQVDSALRMYGGRRIDDIPEAKLLIADAIFGMQTRMAQAAAKAAPPASKPAALAATGKTPPPKAPATPGATRVPGRVAPRVKAKAAALEKFNQTGRDDDNAALASLIGG